MLQKISKIKYLKGMTDKKNISLDTFYKQEKNYIADQN